MSNAAASQPLPDESRESGQKEARPRTMRAIVTPMADLFACFC